MCVSHVQSDTTLSGFSACNIGDEAILKYKRTFHKWLTSSHRFFQISQVAALQQNMKFVVRVPTVQVNQSQTATATLTAISLMTVAMISTTSVHVTVY